MGEKNTTFVLNCTVQTTWSVNGNLQLNCPYIDLFFLCSLYASHTYARKANARKQTLQTIPVTCCSMHACQANMPTASAHTYTGCNQIPYESIPTPNSQTRQLQFSQCQIQTWTHLGSNVLYKTCTHIAPTNMHSPIQMNDSSQANCNDKKLNHERINCFCSLTALYICKPP